MDKFTWKVVFFERAALEEGQEATSLTKSLISYSHRRRGNVVMNLVLCNFISIISEESLVYN